MTDILSEMILKRHFKRDFTCDVATAGSVVVKTYAFITIAACLLPPSIHPFVIYKMNVSHLERKPNVMLKTRCSVDFYGDVAKNHHRDFVL